jgi:hypothetical protein
MTKAQWVRYLEIHVRHHHKIIHDIVARRHPGAQSLAPDGTLTMGIPTRPESKSYPVEPLTQ